jgi:hypothetical protein
VAGEAAALEGAGVPADCLGFLSNVAISLKVLSDQKTASQAISKQKAADFFWPEPLIMLAVTLITLFSPERSEAKVRTFVPTLPPFPRCKNSKQRWIRAD